MRVPPWTQAALFGIASFETSKGPGGLTTHVRSGGPFTPALTHELSSPPMRPEAEGDAQRHLGPQPTSRPKGMCDRIGDNYLLSSNMHT